MGRARRPLSRVGFACAGVFTAALLLEAPRSPAEEVPAPADATVVAAALEGRWAVLALDNGRVVVLDIKEETRREWPAPVRSVHALALEPASATRSPYGAGPAGPPPAVVIAGPAEGGGMAVVAASIETGDLLARAHVSGEVVHLLAAPGGRTAYAVLRRGAVAPAEPQQRAARSTLAALDLEERSAPGVVALEGEVHGAAISPDGLRIYLGLEDRIRTFLTSPLRSSWMLRSPGTNRAFLPIGPRGVLLAARDHQIAWFDPDNLPGRDRPTGVFPTDDALGKIDLPFEPHALSISADETEAAALDEPGSQIALVSLVRRMLLGVREVSPAAKAGFHPDRESLILIGRGGDAVSEMAYARPGAGPAAPPPPVPAPSGSPGAAAPPGAPEAAPEPTEPARPEGAPPAMEEAPEQAAEERAAAPEAEPSGAGVEAPPGTVTGAAPTPQPPEEESPEAPPLEAQSAAGEAGRAVPQPPAPPQEAAVPGEIRGRVSGEIALAAAVVFYGPDSIFTEHARVKPGADGRFSVPFPPPGRYRILLAGAGGAQLSYSPAYYQIVVDGDGISGIDFHVAGKIPGSLKP